MKKSIVAALTGIALASTVLAAHDKAAQIERELLAKTGIKAEHVVPAPVKGLWEVAAYGRIFYVDDEVKNIMNGDVIDIASKVNKTQESLRDLARLEWKKLPFEDSVKQVFGNGERKLVVFSDANCVYCRQLEGTFERVGNLTVYTFIVPMLRGDENNREIVCSKDKAKAWHDWMAKGIAPEEAPVSCDASVLSRNYKLFQKLQLTGAPALFFENGIMKAGAVDADALDKLLSLN